VDPPGRKTLTERLKRALKDSVTDPDRLHQRLFFALCRDLTELAGLENSVESITLLDLEVTGQTRHTLCWRKHSGRLLVPMV
jgi:hypothetical protein